MIPSIQALVASYATVSASGPLVSTYQSVTSTTSDSTTATFASMAAGTASADRYLLAVCASTSATAAHTQTGCTIGGVTASALYSGVSSTLMKIYFWLAAVPTGTTATVATTTSHTFSRFGTALFSITGGVPTLYDDLLATAANPLTGAIDVPANGCVIAAAALPGDNFDGVWTSSTTLVERFAHNVGGDGSAFTGASSNNSGSGFTETATCSWSPGSSAGGMLAISLAP